MCDAMDSLESNQQPKFLASGTGWISESPTRILIFQKKQVWQNAYMFWTLTAVSKQGVHDFPGVSTRINISYNMHFSVCYIEYLLILFHVRGITLHHTNTLFLVKTWRPPLSLPIENSGITWVPAVRSPNLIHQH